MIVRYKVEYEFEAETLWKAQEMLNQGLIPIENMTLKTLEAICSEDRIIPRKWVPKKEPAVVSFSDATQSGQEPEDDQFEHSRDDPLGASPRPSDSSVHAQSGEIEEEEGQLPF